MVRFGVECRDRVSISFGKAPQSSTSDVYAVRSACRSIRHPSPFYWIPARFIARYGGVFD